MTDKAAKPKLVFSEELPYLFLKYGLSAVLFFGVFRIVIPRLCLEPGLTGKIPTQIALYLWLAASLAGGLIFLSGSLILCIPHFLSYIEHEDGYYRRPLIAIIIMASLWLSIIPIDLVFHLVEADAYIKLAEGLIPLTNAIEKYRTDRGRPPVGLSVLVPDYINELPKIGTPMDLQYKYEIKTEENCCYLGDNPFKLSVDIGHAYCPACMFHFPSLTYCDKRWEQPGSSFTSEKEPKWVLFWRYFD